MAKNPVRVLVTGAAGALYILKEFAPSIPKKNITCLTRLDHNRALCQISERLDVQVSDVKNVIIWGNHSSTQYPDVNCATVTTSSGKKFVKEIVADDNWLNSEFVTTVQQRGEAIIKARKLLQVLLVIISAIGFLELPRGHGFRWECILMAPMESKKAFIYFFPVTCEKGEWTVVQGLKIDEFSRAKMDATAKELAEEKSLAYSCLN